MSSPTPLVLVVDDDDLVRTTIRRVLARAGYAVQEAADAAAALEAFRELAPHVALVVTDVAMAGLRGPDLARLMRQIRPDLPLVIISGFAGETVREESDLPSGAAFLQKPFSVESLLRVVRATIARSR